MKKAIIISIIFVLSVSLIIALFNWETISYTITKPHKQRQAVETWNTFCDKLESGVEHTIIGSITADHKNDPAIAAAFAELELSELISKDDNPRCMPQGYGKQFSACTPEYSIDVVFADGFEIEIKGYYSWFEVYCERQLFQMNNEKLFNKVKEIALDCGNNYWIRD